MKELNPDDFEEEHYRRRFHRDDNNPLKALKTYAMVFVCGIAAGIGLASCSPRKYFFASQEPPAGNYDTVQTNYGDIRLADQQETLLRKGLKDIERKNGWYDFRVLKNWYDILGRHGPQVLNENIKKLVDDTLSPLTPMGRLLNKYRGPKIAPQPSQIEIEQFEELYEKHELYQPTIDALMDENHDNELTREERNRAVYKLLHQ